MINDYIHIKYNVIIITNAQLITPEGQTDSR